MNRNKSAELWKKRLDQIQNEYPFGSLEIKRNETGQIHCETGPAYISPTRLTWYRNGKKYGIDVDVFGTKLYFFEGINVPEKIFRFPEKLTSKEIFAISNAEVRYAAIKLYGWDRLENIGKEIHRDKTGVLLHFEGILTEPVAVVKVRDASPDYDGSYRYYHLIVPPDCKTAKEAVAWTFRKTEEEYNPAIET